jgi:hypothetical protein
MIRQKAIREFSLLEVDAPGIEPAARARNDLQRAYLDNPHHLKRMKKSDRFAWSPLRSAVETALAVQFNYPRRLLADISEST